jgi:alpha-D-ribose 1-methylphosphonate 5-triphosphate synthase subunit PhnG
MIKDNNATHTNEARRRWISALARSSCTELENAWAQLADSEPFVHIRPPETGLVMTRARAGGSGQRFNLGEMTVTRATVKLSNGIVGHSYIAGRDKRHAELAAAFDALMQCQQHHDAVDQSLITPLVNAYETRRRKVAQMAAATKVDFFTMARGED